MRFLYSLRPSKFCAIAGEKCQGACQSAGGLSWLDYRCCRGSCNGIFFGPFGLPCFEKARENALVDRLFL